MTATNEIVWEDPPESTGSGVWRRRLAPLVERPGCWANLGQHNMNAASSLSKGVFASPPGRWEFRSVNTVNGTRAKNKAWLYARYLGPDGDAE